jgi:FAD/FMN-containing dehydrogenase
VRCSFLDPHDLSVKIMQTYANFTVGGSLSVNCHGRYVGLGPVIMSVREITVAKHGDLRTASPTSDSELFHAVIGGCAVAVIVEAELEVTRNERLERTSVKLAARDYLDWFKQTIRHSPTAVFHNADLIRRITASCGR